MIKTHIFSSRSISLASLLLLSIISFGQNTQKIYGTVTNSFSLRPISDVQVTLLLNDSIISETSTQVNGTFSFDDILLGLYDIEFKHSKYDAFILPDITLLSSREKEITVQLVELYKELEEFTVANPKKDRSKNLNEMVTNSVKTIYVQDMAKLAGSLDDPIRVAGMTPGVTSDAAFSENFISIRGNSPRGLKYMIEGVELNNPTHFARIGSSGGTFTVFSMQILDKSDFFTGAFPAEYSNALSGVLDVNLRHGNQKTNEYAIKLGTLGLDFAAEGPLNKEKHSSFLFNYRYSVVGLARAIGYPTQPTYQDLSFVLNFPSEKGKLKLFGIAGTSDRKRIAIADSTKWEGDIDRYNLLLHGDMVSLGGSYVHYVNAKTTWKATVLGSGYRQADNRNFLMDDYQEIVRRKNEYRSLPISAAFSLRHKFSNRHTSKSGFSSEFANHNWEVLNYNFDAMKLDTNVIGTGNSQTHKAFTQSRFLINEKLSMNIGVSALYHDVNNDYSIEPRIGFAYETKNKAKISLALGRHSQAEHFATYRYRETDSVGNITMPNLDLKLSKAYHAIVGLRKSIFKNHYFNIEGYYQHLYDVPVEAGGTFSMLNIAELEEMRALDNSGLGANYGIDMGIERYANKGLYYIINFSIFESNYTGGDGIVRSTEFDQSFNFKFLAGKEYIVGESKGKRNFVGWNTNLAYVGGRPYTPVDIDQSILEQQTVLNESLAYSQRDNNLLFLDVTFTYKINKPNRTGIWSLQIKNLFSNGNAIYREYDTVLGKVVTIPSSSFFPNLSYKLEF